VNWLYYFNYNWKVWFMWFHKKCLNKFFIQTSISVLEKDILLKSLIGPWNPRIMGLIYIFKFQYFNCLISICDSIRKNEKWVIRAYQKMKYSKKMDCHLLIGYWWGKQRMKETNKYFELHHRIYNGMKLVS